MTYAPSEDSNQAEHLPLLIRVFAVRMKKPWDLNCSMSGKRRLWSDWADAQAELSLRWAHRSGTGKEVGWLRWGLTSQSTIFQSCRDGAIASWIINQYFRGVKCLAQGLNTAAVGLEPRTSRSGVRHSTTEPPRSPQVRRVFGDN